MSGSSDVAALSHLIERLHQRGRLRVWSLVITIFGDAVVPRGGQVPLATLQEITARMGVEAGALRTAMSRLAAERWVVREKDGRNSHYALDQHGRHAFDLATRRIYAAGPPQWDGTWSIAVAPPGLTLTADRKSELERLGFAESSPGTFLRPLTSPQDQPLHDMLVVNGRPQSTPQNATAFWRLHETAKAYHALIAVFSPLHEAVERTPLLGLDALAARILLIHDWRRIVLHDPNLPEELLPRDWPGTSARQLTRDIYARLAAPSEKWLDDAGLPALQTPQKFNARFGGI